MRQAPRCEIRMSLIEKFGALIVVVGLVSSAGYIFRSIAGSPDVVGSVIATIKVEEGYSQFAYNGHRGQPHYRVRLLAGRRVH